MNTVYDALRDQIVAGEIPPGAPLVETTVANNLGVSRTPVREALRRLEQDGLVERASRGLQVRERSPAEILEIFEVRIVLEGTAARLAAEHHTQVDRIQMHGQIKRLEENQDAEPKVLASINADFHKSVWHASHNWTLVDVLDRLSLHLHRYRFTTYQAPGRAESSLAEHKELVEAIDARDADRAQGIASHHMRVARDIRLENWERDPDSMTGRGA